jgi:hypothetical protein
MVVVLEPSAFGARAFDAITQTFTWDVHDERDRVLTLSLPFREWSKDAIRVLEGLGPPEEIRWRVLVRLALRDELLTTEPISILRPEDQQSPVFQLSFDALPQQPTPNRAPSAVLPEEDEELPEEGVSDDDFVVPSRSYLYAIVTELNRRLQAIAETGCQSGLHEHREWLEKSRREVSDSGLTCLAGALKSLSESSSPGAGVLLRIRFLTHLHSQASVHVV